MTPFKIHSLLKRQLENVGINLEDAHLPENLVKLLTHVNTAYNEADQSRYIIERSMEISSLEMQQLRESLQKEKEILHAVISDGFCVLDPFWKITSINQTGAKLLCCPSEAITGKPFYEVFNLFEEEPNNLKKITLEELQSKFKSSKIYHCEKAIIKTFQGINHYISFSINPLPFINNRLFGGAVLIFRDITERIETENLLQTSLKAAQESSKSKAQFLANMSHEIRTPMNGILGMLQLLMHTPLDEEQINYANKCFNCANSLLRIIGDILDFSKIEAGKVEFENKEFNLKEEFDSFYHSVLTQSKEKKIAISLNFDRKIPIMVKGDAFRIRQIMNNLVNNAIKFTPPNGSIDISVDLKNILHDEIILEFSVSDTGIGIKKELQEKVFEVFSQADESTTREYGGTGLGLAICKHLVNLMGGEILLTSTVGKGSTFTFTLHLHKAHKNVQTLNTHQFVNTIPQFKANILVVEDNQTNQTVLNDMLKTLGCDTNIVDSGVDALKAISTHKYDLIFMDCHMPEMDGFITCAKIRNLEKDQHDSKNIIVALTANTLKGTKEKCFSAGMDDYISKPINYSLLCGVLTKHLSHKEQ